MVNYKKCQFADILEDAKANKRTAQLKKFGLAKVEDTRKDGTVYKRNRTYLEIRKWYYEQYYPDLLPVAKPKAPTIFEQLEEL